MMIAASSLAKTGGKSQIKKFRGIGIAHGAEQRGRPVTCQQLG